MFNLDTRRMRKQFYLTMLILYVIALTAYGQQQVRIGRHTFVPEQNVGRTPTRAVYLPDNQFVNNSTNALVQFRTLPTKAQRQQLRAVGVKLSSYLGGNAYFAQVPKGLEPHRIGGLSSLMTIKGEWKFDRRLDEWDIPAHAREGLDAARVLLYHFGNVSTQWVVNYLGGNGFHAVEAHPRLRVVSLRLPQCRLRELAGQSWVASIRLVPMPEELYNASGATLGRANVLRHSGLLGGRGLTGKGVRVGVWDGNAEPHFDYGNRLHQQEFEMDVVSSEGHGMHVAGTVGGAGLLDPKAMGMAPGVELYSYNFNTQSNGLSAPVEMYDAREQFGIQLTQNSYGLYLSNLCAYYDMFSYSAQANNFNLDLLVNYMPELTHVFASGNDQGACGYTYGASLHRAKNVIYVGAVDELGNPTTFSSWGPMDDGRVVPTVSAKGEAVYSTMPSDGYGLMDGTSMATPTVTGQLALLVERYMQLNRGEEPIAALVRGLAANTATDMNEPGPCYVYGYGVLNSEAAVRAVEGKQYRVATFTQGDAPHIFTISAPAGATRLKVALAWSDTLSIKEYDYGEPALVNDLDLEVDAGGQTHMPWVLDKNNPQAAPTRGRDTLNNLEQVTVDNPQGAITIRVHSAGIPSAQQQYAVTWWFETEQLELSYPLGGELMEPGERFALRCQNGGRDYTVELSYDGGSTYELLGKSSASEWTLTVPPDAPATDRAMVRLIDQQGAVRTSGVFTIMPRPANLTCREQNGGAVLSWNPVSGAERYEIMRATQDGGSFEVVASTTVESFRLLPDHFVKGQRNAFTIRAIAPNGAKSQRAIAQVVSMPSGVPVKLALPFVEEFSITPSPYLREEHGSGMSVRYIDSPAGLGSPGAHVFVSAAAGDVSADYDFDTQTQYTLLGFDELDLTGVSGSVFMRVYGLMYKEGASDMNQLRLEANGTPLPMVDGTTVVQADDAEKLWVWDLSAYVGQRVSLMLRHVSARTGGMLVISNIMLLPEQPEPDVAVGYIAMDRKVGRYGNAELVEVAVRNLSSTVVPRLPLTIEANGTVRGGMLVENLTPFEQRTVQVPADLSTSNFLGELMLVCAKLHHEHDADISNNADSMFVSNLGGVLPMPKGQWYDMLGMPIYTSMREQYTVYDSLYVSDSEGPHFGYSGGRDDVMKLVPSNPDNMLQITFIDLQMGSNDILEVFTCDIPASLYTSNYVPECSLTGLRAAPMSFISHAADGAITLRHNSKSNGGDGEGWLAVVREVPKVGNMLTLSDMSVIFNAERAEAAVTITVDNVGSVHQHDVRLLLRQGLVPTRRTTVAEEAIASIAPGASVSYTFSVKPSLVVPSFDSLEVRVLGYDTHAQDNGKTMSVCADIYAPSPSLPYSRASRIDWVSMYGKQLSGTSPQSDNQGFVTRDTLFLYAEANTNELEVRLTTRDTLELALWVDWNDEGTFAASPYTMDISTSGTYSFNLTPPAGTAPGAKRMRLMLAPADELEPHVGTLSALSLGDIEDFVLNVLPGNYPLLNDLGIVRVLSGRPSSTLGLDTVFVTVSNNANHDVSGFELTLSADGGNPMTERFDSLVPAFGGQATVQWPHLVDLSTIGHHVLEARLPNDDDPSNNHGSYATSRVVPAVPQRDYYLHMGLDTLQEAIALSNVGAARTGHHFGIDMWVRLDEPQTAPLLSGSDYLLMALHGEAGLPDNALLVVYAGGGGQQLFATMPNTFMPGQWYHIAVANNVWGPSQATVYINGVEQELLQNNAEAMSSFANMRALRAVRGSIDNLRFWNKELRKSDVLTYMFTSARNADGKLQNGCVAEFTMNEGPGNTAILSDSSHYALLSTQRAAEGENSVWQSKRQLFGNIAVDGAIEAVRNGSQLLVTFPNGARLTDVRCTVDKHFGAVASYNGNPFGTDLTLDLSQGEAVLLARLDMFGSSHRDTLVIVPQLDLSDEASIIELTLPAANNPGLLADIAIAPVPQSIAINLPAGIDVQRISIDFVLSQGAALYMGGQQQASPLTLDLSRPCLLSVMAENGRNQRIYTITQGLPNSIGIAPAPLQLAYGDTLKGLPTASTAGLPITYSSSDNAVVCNIDGHLVATGLGEATVMASQQGDDHHAAAAPVTFIVEVLPRPATVQPQPINIEFGMMPIVPMQLTYSGLINGDKLPPTHPVPYRYMRGGVEWTAAQGLPPVGSYTLQTDAQPFVIGNYLVTPTDGAFEVLHSNAPMVTFQITDGSLPLPNASVEVNGLVLSANAAGEANTHLLPGRWSYTAMLDGYAPVQGIATVTDADVTEQVILLPANIRLGYTAGANGSMAGPAEQFVPAHGTGQPVSAIAVEGYRFVGWSDGRPDNPRIDADVMMPVSVEAQFESTTPSYTLTYSAGQFGSISGAATQTVKQGQNATQVEAIPDAGAAFIGWSDGLATPQRIDINVQADAHYKANFAKVLDLPYSQNFDATADMPLSWRVSTESGVNWGVRPLTALGKYNINGPGNVATAVSDEMRGQTTTTLLSPQFNIGNVNGDIAVAFECAHRGSLYGSKGSFLVKFDDGDWEERFALPAKSFNVTFDIYRDTIRISQLVGHSTITFGWKYAANWQYYMAIDNVNIEAMAMSGTVQLIYIAGEGGLVNGKPVEELSTSAGTAGAEVYAQPNAGYRFTGWSDGRTDNPRSDTQGTMVYAMFEFDNSLLTYYSLAYSVDAPEHAKLIGGIVQPKVGAGADGIEVVVQPLTEGYRFVRWSDGRTDNPRSDRNVQANVDVTAQVSNIYDVRYSVADVSTGRISGEANQQVVYGDFVSEVLAVPAAGYHFVCWSDGRTDNPRTDMVLGSISLTAHFDNMYTISYAATDGGQLRGDARQKVASGADGTEITALPYNGYVFAGWSDGESSATRKELDVQSDMSLTASFEPKSFSLTYTAADGGRIDGATQQQVPHGHNGTEVLAAPAMGYIFTGWSDGRTDNPRTDCNVVRSVSVQAQFANQLMLTYTASAGGSIAGDASQTITPGTDAQPVEALPSAGYHFVCWSDGRTDNPRTDCSVRANINVQAIFSNLWSVSYTAQPGGSIAGDAAQQVLHAADATAVEAIPATGYTFAGWSDGRTDNPRTDRSVQADMRIEALFAPQMFSLSATTNLGVKYSSFGIPTLQVPYATIDNAEQMLPYGSNSQPVLVRPEPGVEFLRWSDGNIDNPRVFNIVGDTTPQAVLQASKVYLYVEWPSAAMGNRLAVMDGIQGTLLDSGKVHEMEALDLVGVNYTFNPVVEGKAVVVEVQGMRPSEFKNPNAPNAHYYNLTAPMATIRVTLVDYSYDVFNLTYAASAGGHVVGNTQQQVEHGHSGTTVEAISIVGHHFVRWSDGLTTARRTDALVFGNIDVVAEFAPNDYTVHLSPNGAQGAAFDMPLSYNQANRLPAALFARQGYTFAGWGTSHSDTLPSYLDGQQVLNLSTEHGGVVVLFALWRPNGYTVAFDPNGGQGRMDTMAFVYDEAQPLVANAFVREGYVFEGWAATATAEQPLYPDGQAVLNLTAVADAQVVLYAVWRSVATTGLAPIGEQPAVRAYPNPFADRLVLDGVAHVHRVVVVSIAGQLLLNQPHDGSPTLTLSTSRLLPGVYRVVLRTDTGHHVLRVVKQ